jgi:hopanoid biosynthesis associated protein HpnK
LRNLVITADDFGVALEVNEAVERGYRDGVLTAASLMVGAPAATDALARAKKMPGLRVGLHLVLVEGKPLLPPESVPDLVGDDGHFKTSMARSGVAMFFLPRARRQLAAEIEAQFEAFAATGLALDHVNAHKHFHLHPTVASLLMRSGARFGLRSVRVPLESARVVRAVEGRRAAMGSKGLAPFCLVLRTRLRAAGLVVPDHVFGISWSGSMTAERLRGLISHLPDGLNEIYLHPAVRDEFPGAAAGYRYREEFEALLDTAVIAGVRSDGIRLGGFADFSTRR